ncbi:hypothetical protein [Teredinibacter franksiae]|uniref:hypothetical protein n=1 Tax=Teredinibacter franksiae TaxID=2761453 RepID=UPI001628D91C|nr:hypothetical protein [Teredinibacter franksiae]
MSIKIGWLLFVIGAGVGFYFLGVTIYFYGLYLMQADNPARYEYLMGVAIGSMFASPAWCGAAIGAHLIQTKIHKVMRFSSYTICALISLVLLYYLVLG